MESAEAIPTRGGTFKPGAFAPLGQDEISSLATAQARKEGIVYAFDSLPKYILGMGVTLKGLDIIWYRRAGIASLRWSEGTGIKSKKYYIPTLVFRYYNEQLYIVATKDKSPTLTAMAYYAPFSNMTNNNVCMGTSKPDRKDIHTIKDLVEYWEDGFINGEFTGNSSCVKCKDLINYYENYADSIEGESQLLKTGKTILEALR